MWSDRYYYFNIYKDKGLSAHVQTRTLLSYLDALIELKKTGDFTYGNSSTNILILNAKSNDSWSDRDSDSEKTNLVTIVCSKSDKNEYDKNIALLIKIASFLNWQLVDEETDDGIEDLVIWTPKT